MSELERVDLQSAREWWLKIGSEEMKKFRGASAEQALRKAIAISADDAESWRLLAQLISIQGRPGETAECLMSLIRLDAFTSGDLLTLAWPNSAIHDLERVEKLLQAEPENRVPMLAYVGTALNENRLADAEAILKEIIQHHPENLRATALLGILLAERDAPEFLQWRNHIPAGSILEPETWIAMGTWLRTHNQISASARCFRKSVELDPRHLNALQELGQTMRMLGEPDISAQILEHARLQQEITELARRIEEQGNFQPARMIISHLEQAGRIREAWAWCKVYNNEQRETPIEQSTVERLSNRLSSSLPRTAPDFIPGGNYDWSELAEPDWTMSGLSQEPLPAIAQEESTLSFEDKAVALGVRFHFENGPEKGGTIVQTSGGGVAAIDYDRDGWCDLHFTQGGSSLSEAKQSETDSIYRNWHGKVFREVSSAAGISEDRFSQGVSAGDFNNDGFADLYVANLGQNRLLKNNGDGTFIDVSEEAGIRSTGWTTSCAIADLNGDGNADLFNVRYASGADITTRVCRDTDGRPGICRPTLFPAESDLVAISSADGTFTELCDEVGVNLPDGRGFGLVVADFNGDSRLDVFVANDQTANFLLIQDQSESGQLNYKEEAIFHGVASDRDGYPQACMGIAAGDVNDDGRTDLFVTNFANESNTLYESQLHGGFQDTTREAKLRDPGFQMLGFGTQFLDADLDGRLDLVVLNGHILDSPETGRPAAMRPQFFRGLANRRFAERTGIPRDDFFYHPRIGRGLCVLDWNRDGRPDFAASLLDGNGAVVKNTTATPGNWLSLELVGVHSSRDAIGVSIVATAADGTARYWQQTAGDGFAASNERRLLLGLGRALEVARLELQWPSGKVQEFQNVKGNACWTVVEGRPALYRAIAADQ
jgi:cytochrome c-type biogenesis protein CcmH/NrfG